MRRSESSSFPSRPRPENINPSQGQLRGLTPSRLPRSSSTSWRPNGPSVLRPPVRGDIEKSPQRVTTTNITPFVTKMPRIEKQPHQESYLTPLPAEGTIISPEGGLVGRQGNANPAGDNTNTPHPQHRRTNDAVHIPRSSTEYRFRGATTLRSPLLATARRSSGRPEDAPPRLVTTHMAPFVVDMTPPRASPPSQSRTRPAVLTGVRHTSESSLMITQQQLLEPLGPPIPRSRTMSALTPLAALTPNPRQVREAQPASYWSGRFTALNDRFCNENMALTTSKRMPEDRRTRRIFILLENLCVTKEAKESLKNFQSVYLANHKYAHLSSRKDEEKDYHVSMIKRIIGHIKRRSGGAATAESLD
ncbi:MAG: hypothetical protein M1840_008086 [Geoglossum simile]|nr:MAG: hypothetical protein M1840_008086 [Geoglossum simile]